MLGSLLDHLEGIGRGLLGNAPPFAEPLFRLLDDGSTHQRCPLTQGYAGPP